MCILREALGPIWAFTQCFWALTMPLEFIRPYHQLPKSFRCGLLPHDSIMLYHGPNELLTLPSPILFLHPTPPPIHSIHTSFVPAIVPKALSPVMFLVLFRLAYFSTPFSPSFLHPTPLPIHSHSHIFCSFQCPKSAVPRNLPGLMQPRLFLHFLLAITP